MLTKTQAENFSIKTTDQLCSFIEKFGYRKEPKQLQCKNGAYVSSLLHFFADNPGAMEAIQQFIVDNLAAKDPEETE